MDLVKVNTERRQRRQARADRRLDVPGGSPQGPPLCGHHHITVLPAGGRQGLRERRLRAPATVNLGSVEPIDAGIKAGCDNLIRSLLLQGRPVSARKPPALGELPAAKANRRDGDGRPAQRTMVVHDPASPANVVITTIQRVGRNFRFQFSNSRQYTNGRNSVQLSVANWRGPLC